MQLLLLKKELQENYNLLVPVITENHSNNLYSVITNVSIIQKVILKLEETRLFTDEIKAIKKCGFYNIASRDYIDTKTNIGNINDIISNLRKKVATCISIVSQLSPEQKDYIINVKLPPKDDLAFLSDFYKNLDRILNKPLSHFKFAETIKINSFENGSKINDFFVENKDACEFLLKFLKYASAIVVALSAQKTSMEAITKLLPDKIAPQIIEEYNEKYIGEQSAQFYQIFNGEVNIASNQNEVVSCIQQSFNSYYNIIENGAVINIYIDSKDEKDNELKKLENEVHTLIEYQIQALSGVETLKITTKAEDNYMPDKE